MNDDAFDKDKNSNNSRSLAPDEWDLIYTSSLCIFIRDAENATKDNHRRQRHWNEEKKEETHESHTKQN